MSRPTCAWCAGPTVKPSGKYLQMLYPDRWFCAPCGMLQIDCSCEVGPSSGEARVAAAMRPAVARRQDVTRPGAPVPEAPAVSRPAA